MLFAINILPKKKKDAKLIGFGKHCGITTHTYTLNARTHVCYEL